MTTSKRRPWEVPAGRHVAQISCGVRDCRWWVADIKIVGRSAFLHCSMPANLDVDRPGYLMGTIIERPQDSSHDDGQARSDWVVPLDRKDVLGRLRGIEAGSFLIGPPDMDEVTPDLMAATTVACVGERNHRHELHRDQLLDVLDAALRVSRDTGRPAKLVLDGDMLRSGVLSR